LRGDLRGEFGFLGGEARAGGAGVGGSSASISSTCHERFSSRNLFRSAYRIRILGLPIKMISRKTYLQGSLFLTQPNSSLRKFFPFQVKVPLNTLQPVLLLVLQWRGHQVHTHLSDISRDYAMVLCKLIEHYLCFRCVFH